MGGRLWRCEQSVKLQYLINYIAQSEDFGLQVSKPGCEEVLLDTKDAGLTWKGHHSALLDDGPVTSHCTPQHMTHP